DLVVGHQIAVAAVEPAARDGFRRRRRGFLRRSAAGGDERQADDYGGSDEATGHRHISDDNVAASSFLASTQGSPGCCPRSWTHQLSTPASGPGPAAAAAEQPAPVTERRARKASCRSMTVSEISAPR